MTQTGFLNRLLGICVIISAVTKGLADVVNYQYVAGTDIDEAVEKGVVVYEYNV